MAAPKIVSNKSRIGETFLSILVQWILLDVLITQGLLFDQYIGCFYDVRNQPSSVNPSGDDCITHCKTKSTKTYAAIQLHPGNGTLCSCRDDYGIQLSDDNCNFTCSPKGRERCNGIPRHPSVYALYTVCPIGSQGALCGDFCHCNQDVPCQRMTGKCPNGCHGNWTGSQCNSTGLHYIGCYNDSSKPGVTRALSSVAYNNYTKTRTVETCIKACADKNNTYAGAQYQYQCFCGDSGYDKHGKVIESECKETCTGNTSQKCGGGDRNSVYSVCPAGNYGESCSKRCNCLNNGMCVYSNGSCLSTGTACKMGWTGINCSVRDCQQNNGDCYVNETCYTINSVITACRCSEGFQRNNSWEHCIDIDECSTDTCDWATTICKNTIGGFNCSCKDGYERHNSTACQDIDECTNSICDSATTNCFNTNGAFHCSCKEGYERHNSTACKDLDECAHSVCDSATTNCFNTIGGFNCSCKDGYERHNSTACQDIDECSLMKCDSELMVCNNTVGGYSCTCKYGCSVSRADGKLIAAAVVGFVLGVFLTVAVVVAILLILRVKNCDCKERIEKNSESVKTTLDLVANSSSQENISIDVAKYESRFSKCSAITIKVLPSVIRLKLSDHGALDKEFKQVPMETKDPTTVAKNREVKKKNRFSNIIPYDKNRVILSTINNIPYSDYINASVIKGYNATDKLIATQGPLRETVGDFWRMVYEKDVAAIVMITDLIENQKTKCEKYWPDMGKDIYYEDITVKPKTESVLNGYTLRQFQVMKGSTAFAVKHWHFRSYPDHGIPEDVNKFLAFLKKVRLSVPPGKSTVIHCSAGAGRTGTFLAIDYLLQQGKAEGQVDILGCLQRLREQRPHMIQNPAQYRFVHIALLFEYTVGDTMIPCKTFASAFAQLQEKQGETGITKLEVQLQSLKDSQQQTKAESKTHVASKNVNKNIIIEMDATFIQGWKQKDAYLTIGLPNSRTIDYFYSLCREFNCSVCIFLDGERGEVDFLFPTMEKPIVLQSSKVICERSTKEVYGTCYKILQLQQSNQSDAAVYANAGMLREAMSNNKEMRVLHVNEVESLDPAVLISIYNSIKKMNTGRTESPAFVISRSGESATAFFLASLIAFDMINDVREVDIYQIVHDIRKTKPHFRISYPLYERLYAVIGRYIESSFKRPAKS